VQVDFDESELSQWFVVLRDLVALGQVRIKIIFPREDGNFVHATLQRHRRQGREFHGFAVQHRQGAGKSETHGAHVGIWGIAKTG
jgi:hypothetical protein